MAKKEPAAQSKKKKQKTPHKETSVAKKKSLLEGLSPETQHNVAAILFFVFGIFFLIAKNYGGPIGAALYDGLSYLFGIGYFATPLLFFILGISFFRESRPDLARTESIGAFLFLFSILGLLNTQGGIIGEFVAYVFSPFGPYVATLFLIAFLIISLLVIFNTHIKFSSLLFWRKKEHENEEDEEEDDDEEVMIAESATQEKPIKEPVEEKQKAEPAPSKKKETMVVEGLPLNQVMNTAYVPPPLSILEADRGKPGVGDIKANANIIKRTLAQHGITVEMDEVSIGPSVTRYALKPAEGVKLSRIAGLQNELSYALAAHPIRIEAPIPGQSLVGVEVPNGVKTIVGLRTLFSSDEYQQSPKNLLLGLGRGVSGKLYFADLAKMPHMLIAGATGSGKSVTIHAIVTSLLYRNAPENMRFIMIDPKRVELTLYNKIPHLLTPVITDAKKAILALKWAGKEMERRYNVLEGHSVRDIASYHKNILGPALKAAEKGRDVANLPERMPYIVVVVDEIADIMQTYPRELESAIVRLAQMSRAVGIHLILSTQRPSVNVITGLIKANIPARIALQVSSQIDSRTILDASGAEKLLGAGDMLFISGEMSRPTRIQSAFLSETEVKNVVKYLSGLITESVPDEINISSGSVSSDHNPIFESSFEDDDKDDDDEMYEEARMIVIEAGKASTSYLQRRLKLGYARAARLMDMLEERGIISPGDGAKPRQVLERPVDAGESTQ